MQPKSGFRGNAAMRKDDTTGEYIISNVETRAATRTDKPIMDSDVFAGSTSAPRRRSERTW